MNKRQKILIVDDSKPVFMKEDLLPVMEITNDPDLPSALSWVWRNRRMEKMNGKDI